MELDSGNSDLDLKEIRKILRVEEQKLPARGTWGPQRLRVLHHEIIRLHFQRVGNQKQIAKILGCSEGVVSKVLNSDLGRQKLAILEGTADLSALDAKADLKELSALATKVYEEALTEDGVPWPVKRAVAKDVLEFSGYGAEKKIKVEGLSTAEITEIKARAKENAARMGLLVDAVVLDEDQEE